MQAVFIYWTSIFLSYCTIMCCNIAVAFKPNNVRTRHMFKGKIVTCEKEGENIPTNIKNGHCFKCLCRNGRAACSKEICPNLDRCPVRLPKNATDCCGHCTTCSYLGQTYQNDEQWFSYQDPCRRFTCKGGIVTEGSIDCVVSCSNPVRRPGFCCPLCPQTSALQETKTDDPCMNCVCRRLVSQRIWVSNALSFLQDAEYYGDDNTEYCQCFRHPCPVLDCSEDDRFTPTGSCCQECRTPKTKISLADGCMFRGEKIPNLKYFRPELCVFCVCQDGAVLCQRFMCKMPNCSANRLYYKKDLCCPLCLDHDPYPCVYKSRHYRHGQQFNTSACTRCQCTNSQINCTTMQCPFSSGCPKGYRIQPAPRGQCCQICKEQEATCTVYGDPHYQSFDGYEYNFQGSCRYILVKNCEKYNNFSPFIFTVIVKNEQRGSNRSTWTRQVTVRLGKDYNIVLLPGKQAKINGTFVRRFPTIRMGQMSLYFDRRGNMILELINHLSLLWDGQSYLEVTVDRKHRGNVCGLCGNYNGDPNDDLMRRRPAMLANSVDEFGRSWRAGPWEKCQNPADRRFHRREDESRRKQKEKNQLLLGIEPLPDNNDNSMRFNLPNSIYELSQMASLGRSAVKRFAAASHKTSIFHGRLQNDEASSGVNFTTTPIETQKKQKMEKSGKKRRNHARCDKNGRPELWTPAIRKCKLLKKSPIFDQCRQVVNVKSYFRSCIMDVCDCTPSTTCYCQAIQAYVRKCESLNLTINYSNWTNGTALCF